MAGIEKLTIDDDLRELMDDLEKLSNIDKAKFLEVYPDIPFDYYVTIEELAGLKSETNKELCKQAKHISNMFHKSIK